MKSKCGQDRPPSEGFRGGQSDNPVFQLLSSNRSAVFTVSFSFGIILHLQKFIKIEKRVPICYPPLPHLLSSFSLLLTSDITEYLC